MTDSVIVLARRHAGEYTGTRTDATWGAYLSWCGARKASSRMISILGASVATVV